MKKTIRMTLAAGLIFFISCSKSVKDEGLYAKINTNKGAMVLKLYYKETPVTVANFIALAEGNNSSVADSLKGIPYYDNTIFHRVIKDFMIQGGDRTATGRGNPGYKFKDEIIDTLRFDKKGILAMANSGPATNGSQFFITLKETSHLNGRHTIFGKIVGGESVLDSIGSTLVSKQEATRDRPIDDIIVKRIDIIRNGSGASEFNAVEVFSSYIKKNKKKKKEIVVLFDSQKAQAKTFSSGIKIFMLNKGTSTKPKEEENVMVNYAGYLSDGTLFDTNISDVAKEFGKHNANRSYMPMQLKFSSKMSLIEGFKVALLSMSFGQKIKVFIPSSLAYGEGGAGGIIPPNADLIFDIELLKKK